MSDLLKEGRDLTLRVVKYATKKWPFFQKNAKLFNCAN